MLLIGGEGEAFNGVYVQDGFAVFMKTLTLIGSIVALAMSVGFARAEKFDRSNSRS
jgi:NADH-quinone oxidoreductase subunit N